MEVITKVEVIYKDTKATTRVEPEYKWGEVYKMISNQSVPKAGFEDMPIYANIERSTIMKVATKHITGTHHILKFFPFSLLKIRFNIKVINLYGVRRLDVSYSPEGLVRKFLPGIIIFLTVSTIFRFRSFNQLSVK